jgi:deoxycytidylate deaminase
MNIEHYLNIAREESLLSDHHQYKLGACIVKGNKLISIGRNFRYKTHPITFKYYSKVKTQHAEANAMFKVRPRSKLNGAQLFVYRENKNGEPAISKPCKHCLALMRYFEIKEVFYTVAGGYAMERI